MKKIIFFFCVSFSFCLFGEDEISSSDHQELLEEVSFVQQNDLSLDDSIIQTPVPFVEEGQDFYDHGDDAFVQQNERPFTEDPFFTSFMEESEEDITRFLEEEENPETIVLTIEKAVQMALEQNWSLLGSKESLTKSDINLHVARSEFDYKIVPKSRVGLVSGGTAGTGGSVGISLDIEKKFRWGTRVSCGPSIMQVNKIWHSDLNLLITQPLFRGFGKLVATAGIKAAEFNFRTSCRNLYTAQVNLIVKTIKAIFEIVKQEETVRLNKESVERVRGFRNGARLREKIGLCDSLDTYRAEIELRQTEDALNRSKEQLQDSLDNLRDILALPSNTPIKVNAFLEYHAVNMEEDDCIEKALNNRVEIDQAEDQLRESCRISLIAKKNLLPDISLVMNYSNCAQDQIFSKSCIDGQRRESTWGIGFTSGGDLNFAQEQSAYAQSLLAIESSERNILQVQQNSTRDVKKSLRTLNRALDRIMTQEQQIQSSLGELELSKLKFERGMANNFDVIQAEKNLRQAKASYLGAVVEHITEEVQLLANMGVLVSKPDGFARC